MVLAETGQAQSASAQAAGLAQATVVHPIAVTAIANLDFGVIVRPADGAAGFAEFATSAALDFGGGAQSGCSGGSDCPSPHPARFTVTGEQGRAYRVTTPSSLTITGTPTASEPAASMPPTLVVDHFLVWIAGDPMARSDGVLGSDGSSMFEIGGRLTIPVAATPARYRANIPVVVTYL